MTELQPLTNGVIVLAGIKASNLPEELRNHPRIVMWESENQHWVSKDLPANAKAVFFTRWIGHNAFAFIVSQARKRGITIFNPQGTGLITKQVKELLALSLPIQKREETIETVHVVETVKEPEMVSVKEVKKQTKKLHVLAQYINFGNSNIQNARLLMTHANELGISTTMGSLCQFIAVERKKQSAPPSPMSNKGVGKGRKPAVIKAEPTQDLGVQLFDNLIKDLTDMRDFIVKTIDENNSLRSRLDMLKQALDGVR